MLSEACKSAINRTPRSLCRHQPQLTRSPAAAALYLLLQWDRRPSLRGGHACDAKAGRARAHPRVAMTWLVEDQNSMALPTPEPGLMGRPALIMAISAPTR